MRQSSFSAYARTQSLQRRHRRRNPLLQLFIVAAALSVCLVYGDITPADLKGPFVRRFGVEACADSLSFSATANRDGTIGAAVTTRTILSSSQVEANNQPCTEGAATLATSPRDPPPGGEFARFLNGERDAGTVLALSVEQPFVCDGGKYKITERAYIVFVRPTADIAVSWTKVFSNANTKLQTANGGNDTYTLREGTRYAVINSLCLYSELTQEEIEKQRGEKCFPASATAESRTRGAVRIADLRVGEEVRVSPTTFSPVLGWTHRDARFIGRFTAAYVRLESNCDGGAERRGYDNDSDASVCDSGTESDAFGTGRKCVGKTRRSSRLVASAGHIVYADGKAMALGKVRVGMRLSLGANISSLSSSVVVTNLTTEWRCGLFNPQTVNGDIVVDGFRTTTYTTATTSPAGGHALLLPVRAIAQTLHARDVISWLFD